ncbi:TPA: hypothetical protein NO895_002814 [Klebsiella quasipneumoniae subsp. quasipneumoniae]|nr:hypothetical protein [Klebsiella quasipneumoniae subsp. quasipneumoniae]
MTDYLALNGLMKGYLNMDAQDITGADDLDGMIQFYLNDAGFENYLELHHDMVVFTREHCEDKATMNVAFDTMFPYEADVGDVATFFGKIDAYAAEIWPEHAKRPATVEAVEIDNALVLLREYFQVSNVKDESALIREILRKKYPTRKARFHHIGNPELNMFKNVIESITESPVLTSRTRAELIYSIFQKRDETHSSFGSSHGFGALSHQRPVSVSLKALIEEIERDRSQLALSGDDQPLIE